MADHLGHAKHDPIANAGGITRNGKSRKMLKGNFVSLPIEIPRDRHGSFEPQIIAKQQTRWIEAWDWKRLFIDKNIKLT